MKTLACSTALALAVPVMCSAAQDRDGAPAAHTVASRLAQFGRASELRWAPHFAKAGVAFPPEHVVFLALKSERRLEVYAARGTNSPRFVRAFPILAASGGPGPKLREGDLQVPEGRYRIQLLNPNSRFHVSLRVNYPSPEDVAVAEREERTSLGGDIMIHGSNVSVGCLAMGDEVAEDLFTLAARTGLEGVEVWIAPVDFRVRDSTGTAAEKPWVAARYAWLRIAMAGLQRPDAAPAAR